MSTDFVREALHVVAGALIWPVLAALLLLAAATLVLLGQFLREAWDRSRGRHVARARAEAALTIAERGAAGALDVRLEEVLQDHERLRGRSVRQARMAVRVGPALGLMGTLIPMASALQGLAHGNLPALASNMVTAFAATVVGLTISVLAYVITSIREEWVRADVQALAFDAEQRLAAASRVQAGAA